MSTGQGGSVEITNEQAELDGYFEAWARTIVDQIDGLRVLEGVGALSANINDIRCMAKDTIKQELLDAWHHRAGDGAPPECVALLEKHSPLTKLHAACQRASKIEVERDALRLELARVREEQQELAECREMVGALLGMKYTHAGARSVFETWKDSGIKPMPFLPSNAPTRPDAPQARRQGVTLGQVGFSGFWKEFVKDGFPVGEWHDQAPSAREQWEFACQAIAELFMQAYPMLASDMASRFAPPFTLPIEPLQWFPSEPGLVSLTYASLRALLEQEAGLSKQVEELRKDLHEMADECYALDRTYQVQKLFDEVLPEQERLNKPGIPSESTVRFRLRLIAEEFLELLDAVFDKNADHERIDLKATQDTLRSLIDGGRINVNLPEFIDALGDLDVVIEGARIAFGVDGRPIALAIHEANMAKKDGPKRESDGKRLKPPGWKPADVAGLLREQGWQGNGRGKAKT